MRFSDYISINGLRNIVDILLVFAIVYVVLKLLRGTRAVPTVIGLVLVGGSYVSGRLRTHERSVIQGDLAAA